MPLQPNGAIGSITGSDPVDIGSRPVSVVMFLQANGQTPGLRTQKSAFESLQERFLVKMMDVTIDDLLVVDYQLVKDVFGQLKIVLDKNKKKQCFAVDPNGEGGVC